MSVIVTRFAPSPTGLLHIGHVFSALEGWRLARDNGGRFLLRIEDIDRARCRDAFAQAILEDLAWLGLDWDGEVRRQSDHLGAYASVLAELRARRLVYPCFCTRRQIAREVELASAAPHGPLGLIYPGTCRTLCPAEADLSGAPWTAGPHLSDLDAPPRPARIEAGNHHAWRLDVARAMNETGPLAWRTLDGRTIPVDTETAGDVVLARKDIPTSYHLAVTHDDHVQGVTVVTRGCDLAPATHVHCLIRRLMGWKEPLHHHHRLLLGEDGRRHAKRDRSVTIRSLREAGLMPEDVLAMAQP